MKQDLSSGSEIDQVMLAMSGYDLKRMICGAIGTLEFISMEVNRDRLQSSAAAEVAEYIADMQLAAGNIVSSLDRLLATLDESCPEVRQIRGIVHHFDLNGVDYGGCMSPALREKWIRNLSKLPPRVWCA